MGVAIGLQHRNVDDLAKVRLVPKLDPMPASQMLGHFKRAIIKINEELKSLQRAVTQAKLNLSEKKDLNIMDDAEGDVDMVLEAEGAKIEEKERKQYRIKVSVLLYESYSKTHTSEFGEQ